MRQPRPPALQRNGFRRLERVMEQTAMRAAVTVEAQAASPGSVDGMQVAATTHPTTGEIVTYGQVGLTTLGEGFGVRG